MEFSNKLIPSLKHDMKILSNVGLEIIEKLTCFELNSWLFPTKSYDEVSEDIMCSGRKQYFGYLELLIDRLYLIINLLVRYTETFPKSTESQTIRNVARPKNLSLGSSTGLLWKRLLHLKDITESSLKIKDDSSEKQFDNQSSQTITYSSDICNSCAMATSCIKELVNDLETLNSPFVEQARKKLQDNFYDVTQYGCMNRLTTAILQDVNNFVKRLRNLEIQDVERNEQLQNLTIKYGEALEMIKKLDSSLKHVQKCLRNVKFKNKRLLKHLNEVNAINRENRATIVQKAEKVQTLEKFIEESTVSLALFSTDNEKLQEEIRNCLSDSVSVANERDLWKNRFSETYLENRALQNKLGELQGETQALKITIDKVVSDCDELTVKLEESNLKIAQRTETFEYFLKSSMDIVNSSKINKDAAVMLKNFTNKLIPFQITGDPVTDMMRQVATNKSYIDKLEQYNADLLKTIQRVQEKSLPIKTR